MICLLPPPQNQQRGRIDAIEKQFRDVEAKPEKLHMKREKDKKLKMIKEKMVNKETQLPKNQRTDKKHFWGEEPDGWNRNNKIKLFWD